MQNTYTLLDCGHFNKLEQIGPFRIVRPSPGAVWKPTLTSDQWNDIDAIFIRKSDGKGYWKDYNKNIPEAWNINVDSLNLIMRRTNFGHIGIFVEQKENWTEFIDLISPQVKSRTEYKVLNLFAYTGGASLACAQAGASVTHVDASKTSNSWARENAELNNLGQAPIRWITDDVKTFIEREIRRGNSYEAIILDPPSFGRGTKNQVWKIEDDMIPLLEGLQKLMSPDFHFISLSSHSPGYSPISLKNLLSQICPTNKGEFICREMVVPSKNKQLPSGTTCIYIK